MITKLVVSMLSLYFVVSAAKELRKPLDFIEFAKPCAEELKLEETTYEDFTTKVKIKEVVLGHKEIDHDGKCLLKCMSEKEGYVLDGEIDVETMKKNSPEDVTIDYAKCKAMTDNDVCEQAYKQSTCVTKQIKDIILEDH